MRDDRRVFAGSWQLVARAGELSERGASVHAVIAGWPLLLVRDHGGVLRAFHDVCRHRAGPLTCSGDAIVCGYHGWTYSLDGALSRARDFGSDVDAGALGLYAIDVDEWRGLVFVRVDRSRGEGTLAASLGGFADACASFDVESFAFEEEVVHEIDAGWQVYAENYLEGYHIPIVHPALDETIDSRRYKVEVHDDGRWVRHSAPARDGSATGGEWLWRHPNLAINVYPDGMNVERFLPVGPRRTQVVYWYFFAEGAPRESIEESRKLSAQLLDEDRAICEAVERNLDAGVFEPGPLSPKHEAAVAAFQRWLRDDSEGGRDRVERAHPADDDIDVGGRVVVGEDGTP